MKMKDLLKEDEFSKFQPIKVPGFDKYLEKYGLGDILYTALEFYKSENEKPSIRSVLKCIEIYKKEFQAT